MQQRHIKMAMQIVTKLGKHTTLEAAFYLLFVFVWKQNTPAAWSSSLSFLLPSSHNSLEPGENSLGCFHFVSGGEALGMRGYVGGPVMILFGPQTPL
jgi:hypothetical protein